MSKIKENILFALISFVVFTTCVTVFDFFYRDEIDIIKNIINGGVVTLLLLLDKKYKFSDRIKRMLTFIK